MKLGIAGKGGTGKTTVVGTMAREYASRGHRVLAFDVDPQPTLAMTLGIDLEVAEGNGGLPTDLFDVAVQGHRLTVPEIIERYGLPGPDGITLIIAHRLDHIEMHCNSGAHANVRTMLQSLIGESDDIAIVDMEAGLEHFSRAGGTLAYADALMIMVEPFHKSIVTGRQIALMAEELGIPRRYALANKVRDEQDMPPIEEFCEDLDLELVGTIPWDTRLQEAETSGRAPFDHDPTAPGVVAARKLAATMLGRVQGTPVA